MTKTKLALIALALFGVATVMAAANVPRPRAPASIDEFANCQAMLAALQIGMGESVSVSENVKDCKLNGNFKPAAQGEARIRRPPPGTPKEVAADQARAGQNRS